LALSSSNTLSTGTATRTLTIVTTVATAAGSGVTVEPTVPAGAEPVSLTFSNVTAAGETTVAVIEPGAAPPPPSGFQLGPVYYEVSTTASFSGPITLCFGYGSVDAGTPRLFHFENGAWVDITSTVDTSTRTVCGTASSLSPFAVFVSPITRTGFYAPVNPEAGFVNTVKGGSTVPLKFNVYVNGVEKTDTEGLQFSLAQVGCSFAAEDPVDFVTTGGTSLRYDTAAGQFVQNWKTPTSRGCYVVRMTTTEDRVSISAVFKTK